MDTKINKRKKRRRQLAVGVLIMAGIVLLSSYALNTEKEVKVEEEELSIHEVSYGNFEDIVLLNSTVTPKTSMLINILEGGAVQEIFVQNGDEVVKGQKLAKMYNPNAELGYMTQETAITEQINNLRNIRINLKNQGLELNQQLINIDYDFQEAERQYELDKRLYKSEVISKNDFDKTEGNYTYQKRRKQVVKKSVETEQLDRKNQLARINASIFKMEQNLEVLRRNMENFTIKAPISGKLTSFTPELGRNYNSGESIGKIELQDGYKLIAEVDEYYSSKLNEGLKGTVTYQGEKFAIEIVRVLPEVVNGKFSIELNFTGETPQNLSSGMSLQSKIYLSGSTNALLLRKGLFFQSTGGKWVFVLSNENKAVRRKITVGRSNPLYYEITDGLKEGDRVITSSYSDFEDIDIIKIN
jgi:HlyD family secretion protein